MRTNRRQRGSAVSPFRLAEPRLGRLEAGTRHGPRALALRLALLRRRQLGRLRDDRLVRAEHVALSLAVEQLEELVALDRLATQEDLRGVGELLAVLLEDRPRELVRLLDDAADLAVDLAGHVVGVVGLR